MSNKSTLSNNLIISGITHTTIGGGYLLLSTVIVKRLTYNTYMGLIVGIIFFLTFTFMIADLARMFPHESFTNIYRKVLGKYTGAFLSLVFIFHVIITSALGLKRSQLLVATYFFVHTPQILVNIFFIAIALYLAFHGIQAICRLGAFMLFPPLVIIFSLLLLGLMNVNWLNLRPVFAGSPVQWFTAGFDSLYLLIPAWVSIFYLPFIKNPKQMLKVSLIPVGITFPLFFLTILGIVGTFGPTVVNKIAWTATEFFHMIDLPVFLLEQTGLFFLISWYCFIFMAETLGIYLTSNELHSLWPAVKIKWFIIILGIVLLISASLPLNIVTMNSFMSRFYWLFILINYLPTLIAWGIARVRFRSKKNLF